jgi:hypothetical protein
MAQTWFITGSSVGLGYSIVEAALAATTEYTMASKGVRKADIGAEQFERVHRWTLCLPTRRLIIGQL